MKQFTLSAITLCAVVVFTGCSSFRATTRLDLAPFAENTISLASDVEYGLTETSRAVYLREFWNDPEVVAHRLEWEKVRVLLKGVVAYSVELTTLGSSTLKGPERAEALADFLQPLARPVIGRSGKFHLSTAEIDSLIADIRTQKSLITALSSAQPIVDEVARVADEIFDEVSASLDETAEYLMTRVDTYNEDVVGTRKWLRTFQYAIFNNLVLFGDYRRHHDTEALARMFENDPQLLEYVKDPKAPTAGEILAIENRLLLKLEKGREFLTQIQPDVDRYNLQQQQLADLYTDASHQLKRARVTIVVWSRAHRNLSQGITDPARINLFEVTKKAIDTAL